MAGTVVADTFKSGTTSPPVFQNTNGTETGQLCRAWVNFNGTGVPAVRGSFNVSSITDNGTVDFTVNFSNAMPDANFAVVGMMKPILGSSSGYYTYFGENGSRTASSVRVSAAAPYSETSEVNVVIFR